MFKRQRRYQFTALLAVTAVLLTACFRDTSEVIQQQPVARQVASPTPLVESEPTALPPAEISSTATEEPATAEPEADQFALTATALIALQTQGAAGEPIVAVDQDAAVPLLLDTAIPLTRATIPPGEDCVHEIRAGETLFQLSLAYGVSVDDIVLTNGIENPDRIAVGQQLTIPLCGTTGFIPPPTSIPTPTTDPAQLPPAAEPTAVELAQGDTRDTMIEQAQTALIDNAQLDADIEFSIQSAALPTPSSTYTVQQNDTLFGIAVRYGTTVEVLAALNNIDNVDELDAGRVLKVP